MLCILEMDEWLKTVKGNQSKPTSIKHMKPLSNLFHGILLIKKVQKFLKREKREKKRNKKRKYDSYLSYGFTWTGNPKR